MIYILHQVNCCGAFGAGFAKYITSCYPIVKLDYQAHVFSRHKEDLLGTYHISFIEDDDIAIVHLFGQRNYGRSKQQTDYVALEKAIAQFRADYPKETAYCPKYMGCGNAGGNWKIVEKMIYQYHIVAKSNIDLENHIYK